MFASYQISLTSLSVRFISAGYRSPFNPISLSDCFPVWDSAFAFRPHMDYRAVRDTRSGVISAREVLRGKIVTLISMNMNRNILDLARKSARYCLKPPGRKNWPRPMMLGPQTLRHPSCTPHLSNRFFMNMDDCEYIKTVSPSLT
uniref:Uncharacterized protein n=1 Tax=Setaria digitata TaxID=48799 RepID=A0A915PQ94_9BILA